MKNLKPNFNLQKELLKKHMRGQKKYGAFSFLKDGRDMNLEASDELLDAINYLTYDRIKNLFGEKIIHSWSIAKFNKIYRQTIKEDFLRENVFIKDLLYLINELKK